MVSEINRVPFVDDVLGAVGSQCVEDDTMRPGNIDRVDQQPVQSEVIIVAGPGWDRAADNGIQYREGLGDVLWVVCGRAGGAPRISTGGSIIRRLKGILFLPLAEKIHSARVR